MYGMVLMMYGMMYGMVHGVWYVVWYKQITQQTENNERTTADIQ
jgi:hypothetical protein